MFVSFSLFSFHFPICPFCSTPACLSYISAGFRLNENQSRTCVVLFVFFFQTRVLTRVLIAVAKSAVVCVNLTSHAVDLKHVLILIGLKIHLILFLQDELPKCICKPLFTAISERKHSTKLTKQFTHTNSIHAYTHLFQAQKLFELQSFEFKCCCWLTLLGFKIFHLFLDFFKKPFF